METITLILGAVYLYLVNHRAEREALLDGPDAPSPAPGALY